MKSNTGDILTSGMPYTAYCSSRLPCGCCRITMLPCPMNCSYTVTPTWVAGGITCQNVNAGDITASIKTDGVING